MDHHTLTTLDWLAQIPTQVKIAVATTIAGTTFLADLVSETKGWEDLGVKTLLLSALIFVVRLLLKQQVEYKTEIKELLATHKAEYMARDTTMASALNRQAEAIEAQTVILREQTDYYKTVTRNIVEDRLKQTKPKHSANPNPNVP